MPDPVNLFTTVGRGLSAQMVRMNAAASNLANAGTVAGSEAASYRPMRPVFSEEYDRLSGLSTVRVEGVFRSAAAPIKLYDPDHPMADADGNVWQAPIDETAEMVEVMEASRHYQNLVEAMQTAKQLMLETMRT
ncbi:flagellar basal body rod protein FlgC [Porphyrobacter sp. GA68]|uniref:flagellar basal body rod protein FlgC n=1 Tax=Porphyrobacter sp. GA68 TaxID=2883480 RepID=UPI001D185C87|nr:flagellar basal body rod protein FlgC [Porphyrobacter sp. GA68]